MSHVPTVLKSDRSVFDKMLSVDDNDDEAELKDKHYCPIGIIKG